MPKFKPVLNIKKRVAIASTIISAFVVAPAFYVTIARVESPETSTRSGYISDVREFPPRAESSIPSHTEIHPLEHACSHCHEAAEGFVRSRNHFLNRRAALDRTAWSDSVRLDEKCGACHTVPDPADLPTNRWGDALINFMSKVIYYRGDAPGYVREPDNLTYPEWMNETRDDWMDVLHYYLVFSAPERNAPPDPAPQMPLFEARSIGHSPQSNRLPQVANVNIVDLDGDGQPGILVCDFARREVSVIRRDRFGRDNADWTEHRLATVPYPGHSEVGDFNGDGILDIAIADVGSNVPTDDLVGSVVLLTGQDSLRFDAATILDEVGRVSDVRPGDFDDDGDIDFVVAVFGFLKQGEIGWMEQAADGTFHYRRVSSKAGGVHVPPIDLNGDGRLDFIALISQQHEEVAAFINEGGGNEGGGIQGGGIQGGGNEEGARFTEHILFKADSPTFGSSGIELVDLDQDGDVDILYTNGDAFDLSEPMFRPYHGVQWLENQGELTFAYHDLIRLYGAYRAVPGDLDADGDLDIVATSLISDWDDPSRMSILWLENDGRQEFTPHGISNAPTAIITADVGEIDGDGRLDVVTGSMHMTGADPRKGRVTLWSSIDF